MERGLNSWIDFTVIGIYFFFVIGVGLLSMCRKNRESVQGYFLAGRTMHWIPIGASLFASNIGSEHFVGLAGSGAASGIAVVSFEWGAVILLVLLGWFFLPVYLTAQVFTIPEYLGRRFGGYRMRIYQSSVALSLYVLTKVSVDVYAGGVFIQQATGWNLYLSIIPLLLLTALYTIVGGLAAVVFTDALQTVVMMVGAVVLAVMAYVKVGGLEALYFKYMHAVPSATATTLAPNHTLTPTFPANFSNYSDVIISPSTCGLPRHDAFHVFRDPVHSDLPWPGVMVRATLASLWYWCADQVIVQRALAARSMAHAQAATLLAGFLKLTPLFLIIIPGMISRVLYPDMVACMDRETCMEVCNNPSGCSNVAYPLLILHMAPTGMRGLLMAVMVAALMSSLTSIFNSAGTVFTMDIWRKIKPHASEKQLLLVGRLFVLVLVIVSVAWIPLIVGSQEGQLFMYIQAVTGYIAPPICSIFLLAIFVPRINERGAFWGVLAGQATGVTRLVLDFVYPAPACGHEDTRPAVVSKVHFTYFSIIVLGVTSLVALTVSLTGPAQDAKEIDGLTWWSLSRQRRQRARKNDYSIAAVRKPKEEDHLKGTEIHIDGSTPMEDTNDNSTPVPQTFDSVVPAPWCHVLNCVALFLLALLGFLFGFFA
ncbi:sodium/mannose cotransporter SLC5A10-like [Babylonia areolata]|uniref:sodium/mannose cotransporter SLC5A10-like n=1 Tax=Babylonia areolata TaxID=304850 RepID=UPI003FCFE4B8